MCVPEEEREVKLKPYTCCGELVGKRHKPECPHSLIAQKRTRLRLKVQTPPETAEQATVIDWARGYGSKLNGIDMLFSVPNGALLGGRPHKCDHGVWCNGGYNRFALIAKLKNEGLKEGVSDLILLVARHGFHALLIEMKKKEGGVESTDQESWRIRAQEEVYKVVVCEGAQAAITEIQAYLE